VVRFPGGLDDVAVGVQALHADVLRFLPLLDERDAVGDEAVPEGSDLVRACEADPEMEELRRVDRLVGGPEGEREAVRVVEHQDVVVVSPRGLGAEAEVGLVEAARPLLIPNRERQMLHGRS